MASTDITAQPTPGPWGVSSAAPTIIKAFDAFGETDIIIGSASSYQNSPFFPSDEEAALNARQMAAAPQLVAALEACYAALHPNSEEGQAARAALAAAGA